jgi:hypothetical protein
VRATSLCSRCGRSFDFEAAASTLCDGHPLPFGTYEPWLRPLLISPRRRRDRDDDDGDAPVFERMDLSVRRFG